MVAIWIPASPFGGSPRARRNLPVACRSSGARGSAAPTCDTGRAASSDILGDGSETVLRCSDELRPRSRPATGRADVGGDARAAADDPRCELPREPFLRLIEANRIDQRVSEYETWADLKRYCVHSADPVGRLVLGVLRPTTDAGRALRRRLHRAAARELPAGRAARSRARARLPAGRGPARFGVTELDEPNEPLRRLLEFEAERARGLLGSGEELGRGSAAAWAGRSRCSPAGGSPRSRRWSGPTGTSSRRPRPSRARLALAAIR